jgi:DNA helicase-2/ATP-dependent DNA helicase PcrA
MPSNLNSSQQAAVESSSQSLLIVAGPGSGKTHTLTHRIVHFTYRLQPPQKILAITFTRKAAQEMQSRLGTDGDNIFIGTFHQFCTSILKAYKTEHFIIASPEDCLDAVKDLWPEMSASEQKKRLNEISWWKSVDFRTSIPEHVRQYNEELRHDQKYDFDDLLLETLKLLEQDDQAHRKIQQQYPFIFIDEYQDINPVQRELLKLLAGDSNFITAIGDPNQAIYGFRGADVSFFHEFQHDFNGAEIVYLSDNYRNAKDVLAASHQVIDETRRGDVPEQVAQIYDQGLLTVHESATDKAEAEYIVHTIEKLVGGTSMFSQDSGRVDHTQDGELSFGDIAVFYRLKSQARELKKAFERSGMPFHIVGETDEAGQIEDDLIAQRYDEPDIDAEKITLMTLHASKGLEFSCVFICGCEEHLLPLDLMQMVSDAEEERRLLYVGMTRAKHRLYLTHAKNRMLYGQTMSNVPSSFLADIEESLKNYSCSEFKKKEKMDDGQFELFK